jgi:hypothetical protein
MTRNREGDEERSREMESAGQFAEKTA